MHLGPAIGYGDVSRDDVAAVLAELLHAPGTVHRVLELTEGDTPVADAVSAVARA